MRSLQRKGEVMPDVIQRPGNSLTAMRHAARKLLTAYMVSQVRDLNHQVQAETLILEGIDLARQAIDMLRRGV